MATKRPKGRKRVEPERRVDVTRLEYENLRAIAERTQEAIRRLEQMAATQFQRTVEQQTEIDALKKLVGKK